MTKLMSKSELILTIAEQARQRHADQSDTFGWGKHRPHEADADVAQGFLGRDDHRQGALAWNHGAWQCSVDAGVGGFRP
jgi:hypothetical protein